MEEEFDDGYESLTVGERKEIDLADFAWPEERKYPVDTQDHLDSLATLIGRAPKAEQPKIKANAIRIAKRHGFTLPDSWKAETTESADSVVDAGQRPKKKIGTLKVCFLKYSDRSVNGRIYPKPTCDAIFRAAQKKVAANDLPATVFVSHEAANSNGNTELVGRVAKVWQEGEHFYAHLELADTRAAWDMLALAENGALKSESMRVAGVQLVHDRNYDLPLVMVQDGAEIDFLGIDLTTRPGLADSARILQTLYESQGQAFYIETFDNINCIVESKEAPEEVNSPAMKLPIYLQVALGALQEATTPDRAAHQRIHDHLAGVMDSAVKECHGSESANYKALVEADMTESGRMIAKKHAVTIAAAHDEAAKACGMTCEGCYKEALGMAPSDTDNDGDNPAAGDDPDQDGESHKEEKILTEAEMMAALAAKGFKIEAPKTTEDEIAELKRIVAEQNAKIAQFTETAPTQRQTLAAPSQIEETSTLQEEELYEDGDYLAGDLAPKNWRALSNRRVPWPKDLDPKLALHEMAPFLAHSLNVQEAHARGRDVSAFIQPNELM